MSLSIEKGVYNTQNGKNGDAVVTCEVELPDKLSKREYALYSELREHFK